MKTRGARLRFSAIVSAGVSLGVAGLFFLAGEFAASGNGSTYHLSRIEPRDAVNAVCVLFWIAFGVFLMTYLWTAKASMMDEKLARIAGRFMDARRATLLRARSRRR